MLTQVPLPFFEDFLSHALRRADHLEHAEVSELVYQFPVLYS